MLTSEALSVVDASGRQFSLLNSDSSAPAYKRNPPTPPPIPHCHPPPPPPPVHRPCTRNAWPSYSTPPLQHQRRPDALYAEPRSLAAPPMAVNSKRKYHCSEPGCNKSFTTSGHLARHNRIHTGEKNFPCLFPGCQSRFSRQDNMMQHYRTHMSPKSRKSSKRSSNAATASAASAAAAARAGTCAAADEPPRPRPRLHAHHRIQSGPFGVERPLTIDQHLSNYHRSLASTERFAPSGRYDGTMLHTNSSSSSSSSSSSVSPPLHASFRESSGTSSTSSGSSSDSFYQHRPLSLSTIASDTARDPATTMLPPMHSSPPSPSATAADKQPRDTDQQQQQQQQQDKSDGLLQLAHVVSTFG